LLAERSLGEGRGYTYVRTTRGYVLRFHGICDFRIDSALRRVSAHLAPGAPAAYVPLLLAGQVVALLLTLAGECVLHASAVRIGDSAVAFVGASGMGKSTLAGVLCARGARLVTDDVLRVVCDERGVRCAPGTGELRLRPGSAFVARSFPAAAVHATADERTAIRLRHRPVPARLLALIVPRLSRTSSELRMTRLSPSQAFLALNGYAALPGLQGHELVRRRFEQLANVAKAVPAYEAEVPWMPPLAPAVADELLGAVGLGEPSRRSRR
jgi:hypothetical protein